jgi:hypothetical protein
MAEMISSISKAIKIVQETGCHLEPDGEGQWRIDGSEWFDFATLEKRAAELIAQNSPAPHTPPMSGE